MASTRMGVKMCVIKLLFLLCVFRYGSCKTHPRSPTESLGQEVIEIGSPVKELPQELEEEPSAENDEEKFSTTTIQLATKKAFSKPAAVDRSKKVKDIDKIDGRRQDDEESRIEKELADIYKDTLDYKADSGEVTKEVNVSVSSKPAMAANTSVAMTTEPDLAEKPAERARAEFKFQPDSNDPRDIARFRTSVDEIECDHYKLSATKSPNGSKNGAARMTTQSVIGTILLFVCY